MSEIYHIALALGRESKPKRRRATPWHVGACFMAAGAAFEGFMDNFSNVPLLCADRTWPLLLAFMLSFASMALSRRCGNVVLWLVSWCIYCFAFGHIWAQRFDIDEQRESVEANCVFEIDGIANPANNSVRAEIVRCTGAANEALAVRGEAILYYKKSLTLPLHGHRYRAEVKVMSPESAEIPGAFEPEKFYRYLGVKFVLIAKGEAELAGKSHLHFSFITRLRAAVWENLSSESVYGITPALITGTGQTVDERVRESFSLCGLSHVLAVSGLHFGLANILILLTVGRLLSLRPQIFRYIPKQKLVLVISAPILYLVLLFVGEPISAQRAALMTMILFTGRLLSRKADNMRSMSVSFGILIVINPGVIYSPGFQLSFAAVFGIIVFTRNYGKKFDIFVLEKFRHRMSRKILSGMMSAFLVTAGANLATMPFLLRHFGQVPLLGSVANFWIVPAVSFVLMPLATLCVVYYGFFPYSHPFLWDLCARAESWCVSSVELFTHLPAISLRLGSDFMTLSASVMICVAILSRNRRRLLRLAVLCFGLLLLILAQPKFFRDDNLRLTFISVGQADATLAEFPDGSAVLIDAGNPLHSDKDMAKSRILPYLRRIGVNRLKAIILTHPDYDHYSAIASVVRNTETENFYYNGDEETSDSYAAMLKALSSEGIEKKILKQGDSLEFGEARMEVLWPDESESEDKNHRSLVLAISYRNFDAILSGDADCEAEDAILSSPKNYHAHLIKAGHHGSKTATCEPWVKRTNPDIAIVSVGKNNRYRFPHARVVNLLNDYGVKLYRSDRDASIRVTTNGYLSKVETMRSVEK